MLTVGSLFSGVGLLDYGLHLAGLRHAWFCEADEFRRGILRQRWPGVPVHDDVRRLGGAMPPLSDVQFGEAVRLYRDGMSLEAVAERFPVTRQALWERMKRAGVEMRPQRRFGLDNHFYRGGAVGEDWAHNKVEKAVMSGRLERPAICEECEGPGKPYEDGRASIQAHHDDYNEPLRVRWLCQRCHHEWHKRNTAVALRSEPQGGDAQGSLFDVAPVDVIVGGFPRRPARAPAPLASAPGSGIPKPFCGARWPEPLASYDPATCSWKTWRTSLLSTTEPSGERYSAPWPRSGTTRSGTAYPQEPSAPRTSVTGSSPLLPTPEAAGHATPRESRMQAEAQGRTLWSPDGTRRYMDLADAVHLLPTPRASERHSRAATPEEGLTRGETLPSAMAKLLPTPCARDWKGEGYEGQLPTELALLPTPTSHERTHTPRPVDHGRQLANELDGLVRLLPTPRARTDKEHGQDGKHWGELRPTVESLSTGATTPPPSGDGKPSTGPPPRPSSRLRLNPRFVAWMQGAPLDWSDPSCPLTATEFASMSATSSGPISSNSNGSAA